MGRVGNFYFHLRVAGGKLVHRGEGLFSAPLKTKCRKANGIEAVAGPRGIADFSISQEGLRQMRAKSLIVVGDERRIWTPGRIQKFARRVQVFGVGETEMAGGNASRRTGNKKF